MTVTLIGKRYDILPPTKPLSIEEIRSWRSITGRGFRDYFDAHGICYECKGIGRLFNEDGRALPCGHCGSITHPVRVLRWQDIRKIEYIKCTVYYCSPRCLKTDPNYVDSFPLDHGETADRCHNCERVLNVRCPE